jgi:hypothetical protein
MKTLRILLAAACLSVMAGAASAEEPELPVPEWAALACGEPEPPTLNVCRKEVTRVQRELDKRAARYRRTGELYNAGNALVECAQACGELYPQKIRALRFGAPF